MVTFDDLLAFVQKHCSHGEALADINATPKAVKLPAVDLVKVCSALHRDPSTYFDSLSCLTGIDNGPEAGTMEVAYNLYSIPFGHQLMTEGNRIQVIGHFHGARFGAIVDARETRQRIEISGRIPVQCAAYFYKIDSRQLHSFGRSIDIGQCFAMAAMFLNEG